MQVSTRTVFDGSMVLTIIALIIVIILMSKCNNKPVVTTTQYVHDTIPVKVFIKLPSAVKIIRNHDTILVKQDSVILHDTVGLFSEPIYCSDTLIYRDTIKGNEIMSIQSDTVTQNKIVGKGTILINNRVTAIKTDQIQQPKVNGYVGGLLIGGKNYISAGANVGITVKNVMLQTGLLYDGTRVSFLMGGAWRIHTK